MKKILTTNIRWLFMSLLLATGVGSAWADTSTLTFTAACGGSGTADDDVAWTVTSDGTESTFDNTKGIHYGTSGAAVQYINLTTSGISGTITKIVVNASTASGVTATVGVTVGGSAFGGNAQSLSTTATNYTFNGSASGTIVVSVSKSASATKALYVKSIAVTYTSGGSSTQTATVTFADQSKTLTVGDTYTNTATKTPSGLAVTYDSSDTNVATVTNAGLVTANAAGTATITASWVQQTISGTTYAAGSTTYSVTVQSGGSSGGSTGDYTWNLATNSYFSATTTLVKWTSDYATMTVTNGTGTTPANNYLGGDSNNRTSSRFYTGATLTIAPASGYIITKVEFTATGNYASTFNNSTWTNATSSVSGSVVTVTPTNGANNMVATVAGTCGFTAVKVYYTGGTTKQDSEVTFPESSYSASYPGGSFTAPTATVADASTHVAISGATVTYSTSNASVADVNPTTGAVTLAGYSSTPVTITATYDGNNDYNGSTGNYTLTVSDGRTATTTTFLQQSYTAILGETFNSPQATVRAGDTPVNGATVTYSSSNTAVATVSGSTINIVAVGETTITASYAGDTNYKPSSGSYTLTVTDNSGVGGEDVTIWSEDFGSFSSGDVPTSGTNATYSCVDGTSSTKIFNENYAGGTAPELLVGKSGGYFLVTITSIKQCTGTLTLSFKSNKALTPTSTTSGVTIAQSGSVSGTTYTYTITGASDGFTIKIPAGTANARVDDFVLTGTRPTNVTEVDAPTLSAGYTFWPATKETPTVKFTIAPVTSGSIVRYTTDGSIPTTSYGNQITQSTEIPYLASGTFTVNAIAYVGNVTSDVVSETYTLGQTVNSIAAFKALETGTEARLYLDPANDARVLHASGSEIYVRDNTGAICLFLNSNLQNPIPQHDWHVAGWIIGKYQPYNGLPEMVATSNTTTNYMAFAAPVTETPTEPVAINPNDFDNYKADWVTITDLRAESNNNVTDDAANTFKVYNKYGLNANSYYQDLYDYALVDLTGLAVPYGNDKEIVPIYYNDVRPIVYVIDENKNFTSPDNDIQNVTVRLVRTLSASNWNTFAIPFDIPDFNGRVRKYEHAEGTTMVFVDDYIEAGKPYLVKPFESIVNPVFTNVTLSATPAQNVEKGDYSFNAIYGPTNIYTENRIKRFLKSDGYLYYPTDEDAGRLRGMRAYFVVPEGASNIKVNPDGTATVIDDLIIMNDLRDNKVYDVSGRMVSSDLRSLPRGIYIVNGKKMVVR